MSGDAATGQVHFTVGSLVRGQVRREVKSLAMSLGLDVDVEEDRGWVQSLMVVRVRGVGERVKLFLETMQEWMKRAEAER